MKFSTLFFTCAVLLAISAIVHGQNLHSNPAAMVAMSAEKQIVIDGKLDEQDWQRRIFNLNFRAKFKPDDASFSVTGSALPTSGLVGTKGYTDTSGTQVYFLHRGTDLYVAVNSSDSSVCKRWGAWEGDGLYMKVKNKAGVELEYKLMFNNDTSSQAVLELSSNSPAGSAEGKSYTPAGTIVNDNTGKDKGYSLELLIHLDKLGYTVDDQIPVSVTIMDPDYYTKTQDEISAPGTVQFYKSWWGAEWAVTTASVILADKPIARALATTITHVLDGKLDEADWAKADSLVISPYSKDATGTWYMQWGDTLTKNDDPSTTIVKFLHKGTDLYIGYKSNDASVTFNTGGWEADGMFIWMRDKFTIPAANKRQEVKLLYALDFIGDTAKFQLNDNVPTGGAEGKGYNPAATVTGTDDNGKDVGYSGEIILHGAKWGYTATDTMLMAIVMWDMDHFGIGKGDTASHKSIYGKAWWGCEWADLTFDKYYMYRGVQLSTTPVQVNGVAEENTLPAEYALNQNYPNPFNPSTVISYQLPVNSIVTLKVYDILGREVAALVNGMQNAGAHIVRFDAKNLTSGVYFYQLQAGNFLQMKKMMFVK